uniref:Uncharacterized protein n=1 Tax=Uncultured archaeon GZfos26G2 TaxID=3386331 RepID=Q64C13_UNCAG|nr:hypothetical protein GZ26D6_40 [uncultured archaeon GZfos26D6]
MYRSLVSLVKVAVPQLLVSQHAQCFHTLFLDRRFFLAWAICICSKSVDFFINV